MQQAQDFLAESRALYSVVAPLSDEQLLERTAFKDWTVEMVIRHLHFWNRMALYALTEPEAFKRELAPVMTVMASGGALPSVEAQALPVAGSELIAEWRELFEIVAAAYSEADPSHRCAWAGPSMSARSCITARQMETWAHGQEVYDLLGLERANDDRIRNIVILGVNTYGWSFQVRGETAPTPMPWLSLTSPSGEVWTYGDEQDDNRIEGSAVGFAQVVTQTRNIADTDLVVVGETATQWMAHAQCFAGGANPPPAPGSRVRRER